MYNRIFKNITVLLGTFFYLGKSPVAPGTFGTFGGVVLLLLLDSFLGDFSILLFTLFLTVLAFRVSDNMIKMLGKSDPGEIVIDEVCGFLVTMLFIPLGVWNVILGFLLFRLFDILKPYPVRKFEYLYGGYGVVMDDVAAGVYANILLQIINYFWF